MRLKHLRIFADILQKFDANLRKEEASANLIKAFPRYSEENINQILKKTYLFFCNNFIQFISAPKSWNSIKINPTDQNLVELLQNITAYVIAVSVIISFIMYYLDQKKDHGKNFSIFKFISGVKTCDGLK